MPNDLHTALPATPGCVGESVSSAAQATGSGFGEFVSNVARFNERGVGDAVQALQAGVLSDEGFPNTCN
jgi:hypothetical protein